MNSVNYSQLWQKKKRLNVSNVTTVSKERYDAVIWEAQSQHIPYKEPVYTWYRV